MSDPSNYIMASREGLYVVNRTAWRRVADGYFFGVTVRGSEIYCFKTVAKIEANLNSYSGQIVRYERKGDGTLGGPEILVGGLHHNCHQVDFFDGKFYVVDTGHQRILVYDEDWRCVETHQLLPEAEHRGPKDVFPSTPLSAKSRAFQPKSQMLVLNSVITNALLFRRQYFLNTDLIY
jgi:hypothetical protein